MRKWQLFKSTIKEKCITYLLFKEMSIKFSTRRRAPSEKETDVNIFMTGQGNF